LDNDIALDTARDELIYTEARVLMEARTASLAVTFVTLQERTDAVQAGQRAVWRREVVAHVGVAYADEILDECVENVSEQLLRVIPRRDRKDARYLRYFKKAPSGVVRLGLASELEVVRAWPASLKTEPEDALKQAGVALEKAIEQGEKALAERASAMAATADHRVRSIVPLLDDVNAARLSVYGHLVGLVQEHGRARDWPDRFFRTEAREKKAGAPAAEVPAVTPE
jgi:uncharacterized protein (DUF1786 family)